MRYLVISSNRERAMPYVAQQQHCGIEAKASICSYDELLSYGLHAFEVSNVLLDATMIGDKPEQDAAHAFKLLLPLIARSLPDIHLGIVVQCDDEILRANYKADVAEYSNAQVFFAPFSVDDFRLFHLFATQTDIAEQVLIDAAENVVRIDA